MNLKWPDSSGDSGSCTALQIETPKHRQRSIAAVNHDSDSRAGPGSSRRKGRMRRRRATPEDAAGPGMMYYRKGNAENLPEDSRDWKDPGAKQEMGSLHLNAAGKCMKAGNLSASKWF